MPPKPLILGFDTSAAHVAAALLSGDQIIAEHFEERAKGQDAALFGVLEGLLAETGNAWRDLDAVAVGVGPGNFTGVRIAVAAAKGLSLSLGIPAIGVSMFDALRVDQVGSVYTAVPAPRGAAFLDAGDGTPPLLVPSPADANAVHNFKAEPRLIGNVDPSWALALHATPADPIHGCGASIAMVGAHRFAAKQFGAAPKPMYIKSPDAAPPRHPAPQIVP